MPVKTPSAPPLWQHPEPPVVRTEPPTDPWFGQPRDSEFQQRPPGGPPLPTREPNSRHPLTGAPTWRPELGDQPLPPSWQQPIEPNGRNPITGALLYFPKGRDIPKGWEL